MTEDYLDSWRAYGYDENDRPEDTILRMQYDVQDFVETVTEERPCTIIVEGRKASFLISHLTQKVEESGFVLQMLRYNRIDNSYFHGALPSSDVIILTDSIHTGNKMKHTLRYLKDNGVRIKKVFSYLSRGDGVRVATSEGIVGVQDIISHHLTDDEKQYRLYSKRLHVYYRSRIIPMEPELPYDFYTADAPLSFRETAKVFKAAVTEFTRSPIVISKIHDRGLPAAVWGMEIAVTNPMKIIEAGSVLPVLANCKFGYVLISVRVRQRRFSSDFTVISDIDLSCDFKVHNDQLICMVFENGTCRLFENKDSTFEHPKCAICLAQAFSNLILNSLRASLLRSFQTIHINCQYNHGHRPLNVDITNALFQRLGNSQDD